MPDFEGIGEAVTGVLAGRAVEPRAGEDDGHTHEGACLNCGCELTGDYCHCCGQKAHVHRTIGAWWHDFVHSVLHLDGKFWRTIPMLAWRPGELTRRYIHGERAKFISPLALFLFSVFLMFAVITLLGSSPDLSGVETRAVAERAAAELEIQVEREAARTELAELDDQLRQARAAGEPTDGIEAEIAGVNTRLAARERAYELVSKLANEEEQREGTTAPPESGTRNPGVKIGEEAMAELRRDPELNLLDETGWPELDHAIRKAEENPSLLFYKIQANAYKFSWVLIPISLPFLWLLFLHRRRYRREYGAYDHVVFVTYSIAFMSLGAIALSLLASLGVGGAITAAATAFIPPIHIYRQLRGAYRLSRWSALWRTLVLIIGSFVALSVFFLLLVVVGVLG